MKTQPFKKSTIATALSTLLIAPISSTVFAQQATGTEKIEKITITTSTRTAKAVDKIPGAITVISPEEITDKMKLTQDATAILTATVPGYSEASQNMASNGETLRGRIALRLFDGVPQTIPLRDGNRTSTFTDMSIVERIEVINGPSAAEGIGASGGIINYLSKTPKKMGNEISVTTQYESQWREDSGGWKVGFNVAHKEDAYDLLVATASSDRGMEWDANGRRVGMGQSGSTNDSESKNIFAKLGVNFGANAAQRLTASASHFLIRGKGHYIEELGNRATRLTDTSIRGTPAGGQTEFNEFSQSILAYKHADLLGGALNISTYRADQHTRFLSASNDVGKQDPLFAPLGTLVEASETMSQKKGVKTNWSTDQLAGVKDLELNAGVDVVEDTAQQKLALTNRVWVPPMTYKSRAPFAQLSYSAGPVTVSGGVRHEGGELNVNDYTTVYANNRAQVKGGNLEYSASLPNLGAVWRLPQGWSAFASYSKGFTLPNVGIPLRNVKTPGQSVGAMFHDLQAVISDNKEIGVTWRTNRGYVSASAYRSYSELGASIAGNAVVNDYVLTRKPVEIKGYELSGEYSVNKALKFNALYSHLNGKTSTTQAVPGQPIPPLNLELNANDISPNKLTASVTWKYSELGSARLGSLTLFDLDTNVGKPQEEHAKGYTLFDLSVNYDLKKYGNVSLGIDNLLNKYYLLSFSSHDLFQNYFAGRGRKITLSHNIKF